MSEIMRREVVTATPSETLDLTQDLMHLGRVRHLPVLEGERLVGIVTHRDLLSASMSNVLDFDAKSRRSFLRSVEIGEVMARDVDTLGPDATVEEAARRMVERKVGCIPVVSEDGTLLGLVTETDLLGVAYLGKLPDEVPGAEGSADDATEISDPSGWLEGEIEDLRRIRDELRVQIHLAKSEVRDQWAALEKALDSLEQSARRAARASGESARQVEEDARKLVRDLRDGYQSIRRAL